MNTDHMSGSSSFELGIGEPTANSNIMDVIEFRVMCPGSPVRRLRLTGNRYTFGNSPGCSIELNDSSLRPMHAVLIRDAHRILVRAYSVPLEINGNRTTETTLHIGDVMKMGSYQFELLNTPNRSTRSPLSAVPLDVANPPAEQEESYQAQFRQEADRWRQSRRPEEQAKTSSVDQRAELLRQREARLLEQETAILEIQEEFANKQREVEELKRREEQRESQLEEQRAKIRQLEDEQRRELDGQRSRVAQLQEEKQREIDEQRAKIQQLEQEKQREVDEQRARLEQLRLEKERELNELSSKDQALSDELQSKQNLLSEVEQTKQREIDEFQRRERALKDETEAQQAELARIEAAKQQEIEELLQRERELKAEIETQQTELTRLEESKQQEIEQIRCESRTRQEELEQQIGELREQSEQVSGEVQAYQKKYESLEEEYRQHVEDAKQQADTASEAVQKMRDQVAEVRQQLAEAQQMCRETEVARDQAVLSSETSKSHEEDLQAALDSQREQTQQSEAFARKLQVQIDELQRAVSEADSETSQLRADYDDACSSIRQLELLVDQTTNKNQLDRQSWHVESEELRQAVDQLTVDLAKANSELSDLRTSNQNLTRQLKEASEQAGVSEEANSANDEAVESLRAELASMNAKLEEMQSSHDETVAQLTSEREADKLAAEQRLAEALAAKQVAESAPVEDEEPAAADANDLGEMTNAIEASSGNPETSEILNTLAGAAGLAASLLPDGASTESEEVVETQQESGQEAVSERDSTPFHGQDIVARVDTDLINELQGELASAEQEAASADESNDEEPASDSSDHMRVEGQQTAQDNSHMPGWYTDDDVAASEPEAEWQTESPEVAIDNTIDQIESSVDEVISELDAVRADHAPESSQLSEDEANPAAESKTESSEPVSLYEQLLAEADADIDEAIESSADNSTDVTSQWNEADDLATDQPDSMLGIIGENSAVANEEAFADEQEPEVVEQEESAVADDYSPWNTEAFQAETASEQEAEGHAESGVEAESLDNYQDEHEAESSEYSEPESPAYADERESYADEDSPVVDQHEYQSEAVEESVGYENTDENAEEEASGWDESEESVALPNDEQATVYYDNPDNPWADAGADEADEPVAESESGQRDNATEEEEYEHTQHFDPSQFQQPSESFQDEPTMDVNLDSEQEEGAGSLAEMLIRDLNADEDNQLNADEDNQLNAEESDEHSYASNEYQESSDQSEGESPWNLERSGYEFDQQADQEHDLQDDSYEESDQNQDGYASDAYQNSYESETNEDESEYEEPVEEPSYQSEVASAGIAADSADSADSEEDDDSIEAYMNRLLQRTHSDSGPDETESAAPKTVVTTETELVSEQTEVNEPEPVAEGPLIPRSEAPEKSSDLSAMRDLANQTARSAVARSVRLQARNTQVKATIKFACGMICIALAVGAYFFVNQMLIKVGIILPLLIFAGFFFYDGWDLLGEARKRMKIASDAAEDEAAE